MKLSSESKILFKKNCVIKTRIRRKYIPYNIDIMYMRQRTSKEVKILQKLVSIIPVPHIKWKKTTSFCMDFINGHFIDKNTDMALLCKCIVKMHENKILHNDLTYKNIIISNNIPYFIDFGLSEIKNLKEFDKISDFINLYNSIKNEEIQEKLEHNYMLLCNYPYLEIKEKFLSLRRYV